MRNTVPTHKQSKKSGYDMPTMMLLIGMKISFTKKPMKPMMKNPTEVACAIFENSAGTRREHFSREDWRSGAVRMNGASWLLQGRWRGRERGWLSPGAGGA